MRNGSKQRKIKKKSSTTHATICPPFHVFSLAAFGFCMIPPSQPTSLEARLKLSQQGVAATVRKSSSRGCRRKVSICRSEPRQGRDKLREESLCSRNQALREIPRRLSLSRAKSRGLLGMTA